MTDAASTRFGEFWHNAFGGAVHTITHGGQEMRTLVAAVALTLVACSPSQTQAQELLAALTTPSIASVPNRTISQDDRARSALAGVLSTECPAKRGRLAESLAKQNLSCRFDRAVGRDSSIERLADAQLAGEIFGLPVFVASSERAYASHMHSRGAAVNEWAPMLVISTGMVDVLADLPDRERKAALGFVFARERALIQGKSDWMADFEAFQHAMFLAGSVDSAEAGVAKAMAIEAAGAGEAGQESLPQRIAARELHFGLEREMTALAAARTAQFERNR